MPQIGILFDTQKLGSGFYGYTAFRILFSVLPVRELAGCTLYHGEAGEGRTRPYCIAIETESPVLLARIRQQFSSSSVRGLLPLNNRFLDDLALREEVLATAASVSASGEIRECQSRWLVEAWQRAQDQDMLSAPETPARAQRPAADARVQARLPECVPLALRWSPVGRKALGFLIGASMAGALYPWVGWGLSLVALVFAAGAVQAFALRLRIWSEEDLSTAQVLAEARKLLLAKSAPEFCEKLAAAGPQASPLLRRLQASARASEPVAAMTLAAEHDAADREGWAADLFEIRACAWGAAAAAVLAILSNVTLDGGPVVFSRFSYLALTGFGAMVLLHSMAALIHLRVVRLGSAMRRVISSQWVPVLTKSLPATKLQLDTLEQALNQLSVEFQAMRVALERRRDAEFVDTVADLRTSIDQLAPVLQSFREPFVLQAVPAASVGRPKTMSATA